MSFVPLIWERKETQYEINKEGEIRNKHTKRKLRTHITTKGYKSFKILYGVKKHSVYLHRALHESFIGPIGWSRVVDHIDGDKLNNSLENLRLLSPEDNTREAHRMGLFDSKKRKVVRISRNSGFMVVFDSIVEAAIKTTGRRDADANISKALNKERETAYNFEWEYYD